MRRNRITLAGVSPRAKWLVSILIVTVLGMGLAAQCAGGSEKTGTAIPILTGKPVELGVSTNQVPEDPAMLDDFNARVGGAPAIVMWYTSWTERLIDPKSLDAVIARGSIPMITWEPWDDSAGSDQPGYALRTIARGAHDAYIRQSARAAAGWGSTVYLRWGHEMNGSWYPWGINVNGNTATDYVDAWRRLVTIFRQEGATNVRWVWAPQADYKGQYPFDALYPGDQWVDWVGLDGYNWGSTEPSGWRPLVDIFQESYAKLLTLSTKPIMISETASTEQGGDKAAWIRRGFLTDLPIHLPLVRAVIWFDRDKETDWRVNSSAAVLAAFRAVVASPLYQGNLQATPHATAEG